MDSSARSVVLTALAFTAGAMLVAAVNSPSAAVAQSPEPNNSSEVANKIGEMQRQIRYLYDQVAALKAELRKATGGQQQAGGALNKTDAKLADLTKKLESHTHEVLQEGRATDGSTRQVSQEEFGRSGLNSMGIYRVGKAKFQ